MEVVTKYNEAELVLLLQQRSQLAYAYLYDNYAGALKSIIVNIVTEDEQANDVLQEVFIKIWRQIDSYDSSKGRLFKEYTCTTKKILVSILLEDRKSTTVGIPS